MKIYNSFSRKKELIKPIEGKKIKLFVCGPTVYDFAHIGHARTYVIFDCFTKYLRRLGFKVFYLQNITNIDDKIIARAKEKEVPPQDLAKAFEAEHLKDMRILGITSVNKYARATDYIKEITSQVQRLSEKGFAYRLDDGIYFDIGKFPRYGKLSGRSALLAEDAISRIDYNTHKKNRGDFCLWKFTHCQEPGWPAPFGIGRPGWHIEDTAITEKFFGPQYDIHGGGRDLMFPHHEAEIAQMESISKNRPMAKYWMHTGFLTIDDQKMSKSLNNSVTIDAFLKRYSVQQLRFWIAKNFWKSPMNYSESIMIEVKAALEKIEEFIKKLKIQNSTEKKTIKNAKLLKNLKNNFYKNLADNFNTPKAFAVIFEFIKEINPLLDQVKLDKKSAQDIYEFFKEINIIFNIIDFSKLKESNIPKEVKIIMEEREKLRKQAQWQKADELRIEIEKYGFTVDDTKHGPALKKS